MPVFDQAAATYDTDFSHTLIGRAQRKKVWNFLRPQLSGRMNILEVNCGTGEDAIELAKLGHHVIATDASPQMILQANSKFSDDPELHCRFQVAAFNELDKKYPAGSFDMIFSNFGGLNCVNPKDLAALNEGFSKLLKPKGRFISVFMSRDCMLERIYAKIRGRALNRSISPQMIRVSAEKMQETWFYHSKELKSLFSSFRLVSKKPIGIFIPPGYMEKWARQNAMIFKCLMLLDRLIGNFSFCADKGDHIYLHWEKK